MNNLSKPHLKKTCGEELIISAQTGTPVAPKGIRIMGRFETPGTEVCQWSKTGIAINDTYPLLQVPTEKYGHLIAICCSVSLRYHPGIAVAQCIFDNGMVYKEWFEDGVEVGFWGTKLFCSGDRDLYVAILSMKRGRLVLSYRPLTQKFNKNHRIITAG